MPIDARVKRKRKRLWTMEALAQELGVSVSALYRLERDPLPHTLRAYLRAVGYHCAFYPLRKEATVCTTATESPDTSGLQDEGTNG